MSPNNAGGKRTGLLKVYSAAPAAVADGTALIGLVVTVVAIGCEEAGGGPDDWAC